MLTNPTPDTAQQGGLAQNKWVWIIGGIGALVLIFLLSSRGGGSQGGIVSGGVSTDQSEKLNELMGLLGDLASEEGPFSSNNGSSAFTGGAPGDALPGAGAVVNSPAIFPSTGGSLSNPTNPYSPLADVTSPTVTAPSTMELGSTGGTASYAPVYAVPSPTWQSSAWQAPALSPQPATAVPAFGSPIVGTAPTPRSTSPSLTWTPPTSRQQLEPVGTSYVPPTQSSAGFVIDTSGKKKAPISTPTATKPAVGFVIDTSGKKKAPTIPSKPTTTPAGREISYGGSGRAIGGSWGTTPGSGGKRPPIVKPKPTLGGSGGGGTGTKLIR